MDITDKMKKYGKDFLSQTAKYAKHKTPPRTPKQVLLEKPIPEKETQKQESAKPIQHCIDYNKKFMESFKKLTYSRNSFEVWNDFVTMFACAISNALDKRRFDEREKIYLNCINKYEKHERMIFPELAGIVTMALEKNQEQDFLGRIYMNLELGNKSISQFFTPYNVCQMMSDIVVGDLSNEIKQNGYASICDPCCGAGAILIAAINTAKNSLEKEGINYQNYLLIVAQDIDFTVAMMCYIQISLLGVAGYVKVGNSLTEPICETDTEEKYWFTPMYFSDVWQTRMALKRMKTLFEEK